MDYTLDMSVSLYLMSLLIPLYPLLGVTINSEQVGRGTGWRETHSFIRMLHNKSICSGKQSLVLIACCVLRRLISFFVWVGFSKPSERIVG